MAFDNRMEGTMKKIIIIMVLLSLFTFGTCESMEYNYNSLLDNRTYNIGSGGTTSYASINNCIYVADGKYRKAMDWFPSYFTITKYDRATGAVEVIIDELIASYVYLVPYDNGIYVFVADYLADVTYDETRWFNILSIDLLTDECSLIAEIKLSEYNIVERVEDAIIIENKLYLIFRKSICIFDEETKSIKEIYRCDEFITNDIYTNHAVYYKGELFIWKNGVCAININDLSERRITHNIISREYKRVTDNRYVYFIINDQLLIWDENVHEMRSINIYTLQNTRICDQIFFIKQMNQYGALIYINDNPEKYSWNLYFYTFSNENDCTDNHLEKVKNANIILIEDNSMFCLNHFEYDPVDNEYYSEIFCNLIHYD